MDRRLFLKGAAAIPLRSLLRGRASLDATTTRLPVRRVRPSDPSWPNAASWERLNARVEGNLIQPQSLLAACESKPSGATCLDALKNLTNPYYIADQSGGTLVSGWMDAWAPAPSAYAVALRSATDAAAAIDFARENNLRLVVKGGGHSYQGTSNAADSLLLWTRPMNKIGLHDEFIGQGCAGTQTPTPAVTVEAGAVWMDVYDVVTTRGGRYVQGGGCGTVGVAGLVQSGGFGSFSKGYGMAAAGLLEAEIVTADGMIRRVNACKDSDLFWAMKGGGGGSFDVVTSLTLKTHALPTTFGDISVKIRAKSNASFRQLIGAFLRFYSEDLFNPHWGESINLRRSNLLEANMVFQGLEKEQAAGIWSKFLSEVTASPEVTLDSEFFIEAMPAQKWWDIDYLEECSKGSVLVDSRPGASRSHAWWVGDNEEVGRFIHGYQSVWLPAALLQHGSRERLASALFAATRHWTVGIHFNKGLAGSPAEALAVAKDTPTNPAVLQAFALAIISGGGPAAYSGLPGPKPDLADARTNAREIAKAMDELRRIVPDAGSYVAESNYFQRSWQRSFWGTHYARLRTIKARYDPDGLFIVHHGVGSEEWSADGFSRTS
jgi:FAD/FMN-containing dehydrogenase